MDDDDLPDLPLSMRKANLTRLLARRPDRIFLQHTALPCISDNGHGACNEQPSQIPISLL